MGENTRNKDYSFAQSLDYIDDAAIIVINRDLSIDLINKNALDVTGWEENECLNKNIYEILKIEDEQLNNITKPTVEKILLSEEIISSAYILSDKKGYKKNIFLTILPLSVYQEGASGLSFIFREVQEHLFLLNQLQESERKHRGLFENALEGIFIFDDSGKIIDFNPSACEIYQKSNFDEISIHELFPHNTRKQTDELREGFLKKGYTDGLYKYLFPDQSVRYIHFKAKANYLPGFHLAVFNDDTDRILAEKALSRSEANLKAIFDNTNHNITLIGLDYKIIAANKQAQLVSMLLLGRDMLMGDDIRNYIQDYKKEFEDLFNRSLRGELIRFDLNLKDLNNEDNWFEISFIPISDKSGIIKSICYTSTDISYRKRETILLSENEKKFRFLSENSPDIIYIVDLSLGKNTYFNREEILGYDSRDLEEQGLWQEILHPEDKERFNKYWVGFINSSTNATASIEYRLKNLSGEYDWVFNRHRIIEKNELEKPAKILCNLTIISERKRTEEAFRQSEAKLIALLENTSDLVWSIDIDFNITTANSAFKKLIETNYKRKINIGDNLLEITPSLMQDGWLALHKSALKGKKVNAEFSWKSAKGDNLFYEISYNPIFDIGKKVNGVSVFARDITQRKSTEATIIQTNFELDSFVYRASHDLRAPLRSILGLVNIINTEDDEDERKKYLKLIEKSAFKLDNFISDLINFSRNSRSSLDVEEINFESIISDCLENLQYMENADKVKCKTNFKLKTPFYSDPKRIAILIQNLLSNAMKYQNPLSKDPYVQINIVTEKGFANITIKDNGVGIREEYLSKIFDMFFRASENSFGSGLGLYIAKQAIEKLEGTIRVESVPGAGTSFIIKIPNLSAKD